MGEGIPFASMAVLPADARASFERQGYLVLEDFVSPAQCAALRQRAEDLVAGFDAKSHRTVFTTDEQARRTDDYFLDSAERIHFFFEEEAFDDRGALRQDKAHSINKIGHALHELDPVFEHFSRGPALGELVEALGLPQPRLQQSMYIFKQPGIGGAVRLHQDSTYLHTRPERLLGLWFALDDADRENGCLWVLPGGHRQGLRSRFVREGRATTLEVLDPRPWDESELVPVPARSGTVVVLDGLLPHSSEANRSSRPRHAYTLHLVSAQDEYPESNWLWRSRPAPGFRAS